MSAVCSTFAYIILFEIERGHGLLAPLGIPMVIESTFMSLLQIQKELWSFLMISSSRGVHIGFCFN